MESLQEQARTATISIEKEVQQTVTETKALRSDLSRLEGKLDNLLNVLTKNQQQQLQAQQQQTQQLQQQVANAIKLQSQAQAKPPVQEKSTPVSTVSTQDNIGKKTVGGYSKSEGTKLLRMLLTPTVVYEDDPMVLLEQVCYRNCI